MRFFMLTSALVAISFGASAQAEPYRLAVGDQLSLQYDLIESPRTSTIDLDGNLRLPELGSIPAQGWTLDEMEQEISGQMLDAGMKASNPGRMPTRSKFLYSADLARNARICGT